MLRSAPAPQAMIDRAFPPSRASLPSPGKAHASTSPAAEMGDREVSRNASNRRPSATLAFVLMTQIQFLATLSLVDYAVTEDSWLADFIVGLRYNKTRACHLVFCFSTQFRKPARAKSNRGPVLLYDMCTRKFPSWVVWTVSQQSFDRESLLFLYGC